jgi:NIMA (never in mitosis gene a)-related kinase
LNENNQIKIGDFGVSRTVFDKTYTSCGTFEYMSPEMRSQQGHTYNTDIWSAGCILYELITLKRYFNNSNDSIDNLNTKNIFKILLKKYI